jgi:hypothetical protein
MRANTARVATAAVYAPVTAPVNYYEPVAVKEAAHNGFEGVRAIVTACAAPFIGLAFVVGLPIIGLAALAWMLARVPFVRNVALFLAAPFIGLAYALAFPFVGVGALAWVAVRALLKRPAAA